MNEEEKEVEEQKKVVEEVVNKGEGNKEMEESKEEE